MSRRDGYQRTVPLTTIQATGQKALFINPGFTKRIIGLREEESAALLKLLFKVRATFAIVINRTDPRLTVCSKHISHGQDFQVRVKWEEGTVALWDNRVTAHTAISDYNVHDPQEGLRHGFRITTLADKPANGALESTW